MPTGFLIHCWTYKSQIRLAGRLASGESFAAIVPRPPRPRFFPDSEGPWQGFSGTPLRVQYGGSGYSSAGYERGGSGTGPGIDAGMSAADEFLAFKGIRGSLELRGTPRPGRRVAQVFANPEVLPSTDPPRAVWAALDIETDRENRVSAVSLVQGERRLVLFHGPPLPQDYVESHESEAALLEALAARIRQWDPDILTGWNILDFDLPVLWDRYRALGIPMDFSRSEDEACEVRILPSGVRKPIIPGRQTLDAMRVARGSGRSFEDLRLETVAQSVLGRGKVVDQSGEDKLAELERLRIEEPGKFCEYCLEDSVLVLDILSELGLDALSLARAQVTGIGLDLAWTSIPSFERIYGMELIARRILPPPKDPEATVSGAAGGTVLEPIPGLFEGVLVFDFRSLYPSIMRTFNIDPLSWMRAGGERGLQDAPHGPGTGILSLGSGEGEARIDFVHPNSPETPLITAPNGARFTREPGILPQILDGYFASRQAAIDAGDDTGAHVYKILMNSFYGVLGSPGCLYGRTELAGAITGFGRMCLLFARDYFRKRSITVLYGDTDSVFLYDRGRNLASKGATLAAELNAELSRQIREVYGLDSHIQIRFEKAYAKFLLPRLRSSDPDEPIRGRAKGYAGRDAATGKVEVKGMESVRSDYTALARKFQTELLGRIFDGQGPAEIEAYIRDLVATLQSGRLDGDLVFKKVLRRPAQEYTKSAPPQVRAARLLGWTRQRGRVSYLMTLAGPEPVQKLSAAVDYRFYIEHQLAPIWKSLSDAADLGSRLADLNSVAAPFESRGFMTTRPFDDQLEFGFS